eukprot:scaffold95389_cov63-Phaeocystis_antarctica.AAC.2
MKDGPAKSAWHSEHELTLRKQGNSSSSATLTEPAEAAVGAVGGESDSTLGLRVIPGVGGAAKVGAVARSGNSTSPSKTTVVEGVSSTFSEDEVISLSASASGGGTGGGSGACVEGCCRRPCMASTVAITSSGESLRGVPSASSLW